MPYALERGKPPEIDYLNGEVVRRGDVLGVPVPVNRALGAMGAEIAAGRAPLALATLRAVYEETMSALLAPRRAAATR